MGAPLERRAGGSGTAARSRATYRLANHRLAATWISPDAAATQSSCCHVGTTATDARFDGLAGSAEPTFRFSGESCWAGLLPEGRLKLSPEKRKVGSAEPASPSKRASAGR